MFRFNNNSWRAVGIVAVAGAIAMVSTAVAAASADETAIRAQTLAWGKAFNGGDAKGVTAQYADDALVMPPNAPAVSGKAAILDFFTKEVAGAKAGGAVFVINPKTDVGVSGKTGWESGSYKVTVKGAIVETGKFLSVSRKKDGRWLYYRDTWNADAPPPPPAPPAAPAVQAPAPKK